MVQVKLAKKAEPKQANAEPEQVNTAGTTGQSFASDGHKSAKSRAEQAVEAGLEKEDKPPVAKKANAEADEELPKMDVTQPDEEPLTNEVSI